MLKNVTKNDPKAIQMIWNNNHPIQSLQYFSDQELFTARAHEGSTVLMAAIAKNNTELSQTILERLYCSNLSEQEKKAFLNQLDDKHRNALHLAIKCDELHIFRVLVKNKDIDINALNKDKLSTFQYALCTKHPHGFKMAKDILAHKDYVIKHKNISPSNEESQNPLTLISDLGVLLLSYEFIKSLQSRKIIFTDKFHQMVRILLNKGGNIHEIFDDELCMQSILALSLLVDGLDTTVLLLNQGAYYDQNITSKDLDCIQYLKKHMDSLESEINHSLNPVNIAEKYKHAQDKYVLIKNVDRLFKAVQSSTFEACKEILHKTLALQLNPNLRTVKNGDSLLHLAYQRNDTEGLKIANELLRHGADLTYKNNQGDTPLDVFNKQQSPNQKKLVRACLSQARLSPEQSIAEELAKSHQYMLAILFLKEASDELAKREANMEIQITKYSQYIKANQMQNETTHTL